MLDRINASPERLHDAFRALHMRRDGISQPVRFLTGRAYDRRIHFQYARLAFLFRVHDTARDHQLDEIRLSIRDLIDILHRLFRGRDRVRERSRNMSARYRDPCVGGEDPGARCCGTGCAAAERRAKSRRRHGSQRDPCQACPGCAKRIHFAAADTGRILRRFCPLCISVIDLVSHFAVIIQYTANRSDRGHTASQLCLRESADHSAHKLRRHRIGGGKLHKAHIVLRLFLLCGGLAARIEMNMHIDEAGHQESALQIRDPAVGGEQRPRRQEICDLSVLHNDCLSARLHIRGSIQYKSIDISCFHIDSSGRPPSSSLLHAASCPRSAAGANLIRSLLQYHEFPFSCIRLPDPYKEIKPHTGLQPQYGAPSLRGC